VDDSVREREKFTTSAADTPVCLGPGDMIFMQIFIYRFTDGSLGSLDDSDVTGGARGT
jgi:hypothetical protein